MLKYDEWVVPGEVEYAEQKAAQIEAKIQKCREGLVNDTRMLRNVSMQILSIYIQITEHIIARFEVTLPYSGWGDTYEYMHNNEMMLDRLEALMASVDEPKIFDLPAEDIRNSIPEWNDSLLPDDIRKDIMEEHSIRHMVADALEYLDGNYDGIKREFKLNDSKCDRVREIFVRKMNTDNKPAAFTELEEKIADSIKVYCTYYDYGYHGPWYFPLAMSEKNIIDVIHEAYLNASKRSRRIIPDKIDYANINGMRPRNVAFGRIANYECLYQGEARNMTVRFLFDYKSMKIVIAYPVMKGQAEKDDRYMSNCYDKQLKRFDWR